MSSFLSRLSRQFTSSARSTAIMPEGSEKATIAAGCFWGPEHMYRKHFGDKGLIDARVGYTGGDFSNPSYRNVCSGKTGHAESLQIIYDPEKLSYRTLIEFFYKMHDPTQLNRQGPDVGHHYRSAIFYHSPEQEQIAKDVTEKVQKEWYKSSKVLTEVLPAGQWWEAEDYHQNYLHNNPYGYECPTHFLRNFPALSS